MFCCWSGQRAKRGGGRAGEKGGGGGAELDAQHQPWYFKQPSAGEQQPRQPLFEAVTLPTTFPSQTKLDEEDQLGQVVYVNRTSQQNATHHHHHHHQGEEKEDEGAETTAAVEGVGERREVREDERQFAMDESGTVEVGSGVALFAAGGSDRTEVITKKMFPEDRGYHIPRPISRLVRMSTTADDMDDYIRMNPVIPVGASNTLPLTSRNQHPLIFDLHQQQRIFSSYIPPPPTSLRTPDLSPPPPLMTPDLPPRQQ